MTVPAHTTAEILLDNDSLTTAYLSLLFSGGKGSQITVAYAEALYRDTQTFFKDDRNEVKNKQFLGYEDIVRRTAATAGSIRHCGGVHGGMSN